MLFALALLTVTLLSAYGISEVLFHYVTKHIKEESESENSIQNNQSNEK